MITRKQYSKSINFNANLKMTQRNISNVKFSNSQLSKLKSGTKNCTEVTFSSNVVGDSNDETNFLDKLLLDFVKVLQVVHQLI